MRRIPGPFIAFLLPGGLLLLLFLGVLLIPGEILLSTPGVKWLFFAGFALNTAVMVFRGVQISGSRNRMESLYLEYDRRYRTLVDLTADGFVLVLDDGRLMADHTLYSLTGYEKKASLPPWEN